MTRDPPYTLEILRLAASLPIESELADANGTGEARSATCGSTLRTQVRTDDGRIQALAQRVVACAYGQASAALLQQWAPGRVRAEVTVMRAALRAWLDGRSELPQAFAPLAPAIGRTARYGAVLLPFEALLNALSNPPTMDVESTSE